MKSPSTSENKWVKILIPLVVVLGAIYLIKSGYHFGQWLHIALHN